MKDIHELKDNQLLSITSTVAARAGCVHSMGRKGGARTHPQHHHPVQPILQEISTNPRKSTNNASNTAWSTPKGTRDIDDIPPQPTSCVGGASPPPHIQRPFTH